MPDATVTSLGEYRKQLAALVVAAKVDNVKFEDVICDEVQHHFFQGNEIKETREMIKNLQKREGELLQANETLSMELDRKQSQIDDLSALEIDLQQAQRQIVSHKNTIDDLTQRVERYRGQAKELIQVKRADAAAGGKIENLQMTMRDQQTVIDKLMEDNRNSEAMFEQRREADAKALERKNSLLARKEEDLVEQAEKFDQQAQEILHLSVAREALYSISSGDKDTNKPVNSFHNGLCVVRAENLDLLEENLRLLKTNDALEEKLRDIQAQLSETSASRMSSDRVFAGIVSETKSLWHFHHAFSELIGLFAKCFSPLGVSIPSLESICTQLDAIQYAFTSYHEVKEVVRATNTVPEGGMEQAALCIELDSLAAVAFDTVIKLESLHSGLWCFLNKLVNG